MALIKCPECGKEISDIAPACIHCGFPLSELKNNSHVDVTKTPSNNTITTSKASDVSKENEERFPVLSENDITLNDTMNYSITAKGANLGANRAGLVNYLIENKGISFDEAFYVSMYLVNLIA